MTKERPTSNVQRPTSNASRAARHRAYDLEERLRDYAVRIIRPVDTLKPSLGGKTIASQLMRSGASPALNHGEVQAAESRDDFIHKVSICLKELRESRLALLLAERVPLAHELDAIRSLACETEPLIRIFATRIKPARANAYLGIARIHGNSAFAEEDHWTLDVIAESLDDVEGGQR